MKTTLAILVALLAVAVIVLGIMFLLATPRSWPIASGTVKAKKVEADGQHFVRIDGEAMNYLGQVQSINVEFDAATKRITLNRCMIRWNPFSKITVNNQWPVFYPLDDMKPGKYTVVYNSSEGQVTAGTFDMP